VSFNADNLSGVILRGNFKMLPESFYSREIQAVQPFKLCFLQNSVIVQIHTSARDCRVGGNIPGSHFVKIFSALPSHS